MSEEGITECQKKNYVKKKDKRISSLNLIILL